MGKIPVPSIDKYPDLSDLYKQKEERRKELAKLPISRKLEMVRQLQNASQQIKTARLVKKAGK